MVKLIDLEEEVGVENWLISEEEIEDRRLIKQTCLFNVYQADWFGNVLVYERRRADSDRKRSIDQASNKDSLKQALDELPNQLPLSWSRKNLSRSQQSLASISDSSSSYSSELLTDSAYSSISSTPQHDTKSNSTEFTFPSRQASPLFSLNESPKTINQRMSFIFPEPSSPVRVSDLTVKQREREQELAQTRPITTILNKDSLIFHEQNNSKDNQVTQCETKVNTKCHSNQSCWSELNELRLIAHEGFMLFMGASMDEETTHWSMNSLVIQMNHPKAICLHNLLHGRKHNLNLSPLDRFLANPTSKATASKNLLSVGAKLNICQQVTNAMTYLHAKNIVHAKLTSLNIFLEPNQRVKISLIDEDRDAIIVASSNQSGKSNLKFNLPSLTYLSPEIVRTIRVLPVSGQKTTFGQVAAQVDQRKLTDKSDVYSFGTLLFELFEERFPFSDGPGAEASPCSATSFSSRSSLKSESLTNFRLKGNINKSACELIHQIGSGQITTRNQEKLMPNSVRVVLRACWSSEPNSRPQFRQLHFA